MAAIMSSEDAMVVNGRKAQTDGETDRWMEEEWMVEWMYRWMVAPKCTKMRNDLYFFDEMSFRTLTFRLSRSSFDSLEA